ALALAKDECGRLDERLMYTTNERTEPSENPWVGVLLEEFPEKFKNTACVVVIINELHVLTTATCVKRFKTRFGTTNAVAMLGVWDENTTPDDELQCNDKGYCVPGPVLYNVTEIKVHPESDRDTGDNDLAILRLAKSIEWSDWIQPICMQGSDEPESLINRNLHYSGFNNEDSRKSKGLAMTVSRQKCKQLTSASILPPENQVCAYPVKRIKFYPGSVLMDVDVQRDVPKSFYLVALLVKDVDAGEATTQIFQDVRPARSWIMENSK
ncbi:hypothetical protein KR018_001015, partial [Drosophila ironensis]